VLTASAGQTLTINAPIAVTGGSSGVLTKTGAGNVTLNVGSSYDAVTYVTQGTLAITHNNALGSTVGNTVVNGEAGGKLSISNNITVAEPLTILGQNPNSSSTVFSTSGANTLSGAITISNDSRFLIAAGSLTITGGVTGSNARIICNPYTSATMAFTTTPLLLGSGGVFWLDTPGLAVLGVAGNTFGTTNLSAGTLRLDVTNALPSTSVVAIGVAYANGGTLDLNGNSQTISGLNNYTALGTPSSRVVTSAAAATLTLNSSTTAYGFDGNFTGALSIVKNGTNTVTFSGTGLHTGDTVVNTGTLALGSVNALQASTLDTGTSGTQAVTFTVVGTNTYYLGGLKGADDLAIGANTISVGANNQSTSFTGVIGIGAGGLTKVGAGVLTLVGASSYTGATTVNGGTLTLGFGTVASNIISTTSALSMGGGTLQMTGTGTQTVNGLTTTANTASRILLGANETLTLGALTSAGASSSLNFNTVAGGANATTTTIGTGIIRLTGLSTTNAGFTVSDVGGFGLAILNGSGQVVRRTTTTLLPTTGATSGNDYLINNNGGVWQQPVVPPSPSLPQNHPEVLLWTAPRRAAP
jgi:autotransporter-associated beta strand protein